MLHNSLTRPKREHIGKIALALDLRCCNVNKPRGTFAQDGFAREVKDWSVSTCGKDGATLQDMIQVAVQTRLPENSILWQSDNGLA